METRNILLCGVGGQGTVLASKLLAQCAINRGLGAHTAETIGMAQQLRRLDLLVTSEATGPAGHSDGVVCMQNHDAGDRAPGPQHL